MASKRSYQGKSSTEYYYYISILAPDASALARAVRLHWRIENSLHWCMDVSFNDDLMRARTDHAAHNLDVLRQLVLNLLRHAPNKRKGSIKTQRLLAASSEPYRETILGLL